MTFVFFFSKKHQLRRSIFVSASFIRCSTFILTFSEWLWGQQRKEK